MQALTGLAWLLVCQSAGEVLARLLHVGLPGPVLGMLLLLVALAWPLWQRRAELRARAGPLLLAALVGGAAASASAVAIAMGVPSPPARGFALGTASHGLGAARAMQEDADAGAYAALALGLQVILASLLMPWILRWW